MISIPFWRFTVKDEEVDVFDYRRVGFCQWLVSFLRETTLQGVPMIMSQPGIFKKLFWLIAMALCAFGLEWELAAFFTKFLSWTPSTSVTIQTARVLPFPAITICNNNPVTTDWYTEQKSNNRQSSAEQQNMTMASNTSQSPAGGQATSTNQPGGTITPAVGGGTTSPPSGGAFTVSPNAGTETTLPHFKRRKRQAPQPQQPSSTQQQRTQPAAPNFVASMQQKLALQAQACLIPYENRSEAGHQLCDMVLTMEYRGESLDPGTNFSTWHWNPFYGNCFTFNAGYNLKESGSTVNSTWAIKMGSDAKDGIRMSTQSGDSFGLRLLLNTDIIHYLPWTRQVGWRIVIHNQTEMPFPEESGVFVSPGTSTRIGISMSYIKRLGIVSNFLYNAPYSDCADESRLIVDDPRNAYSKMLEVSYTKSGCLKTCYQRNVMETCGCFDFNYPSRGAAFGDMSVPPCTFENKTLYRCQLAVAELYQKAALTCDCPETCAAYSFEATISTLKWPSVSETPLRTICGEIYDTVMSRANKNDTTCTSFSYLAVEAAKQNDNVPPIAKRMKQCSNGVFRPDEVSIASFDDMATHVVGAQFAEVFIFYKDFNYQTIVENEFLEFADLLAYMGGILGLFFGFTFLTLFEYVQFLIDLFIIGFGRLVNLCCNKSNKTSDFDPEKGKLRLSEYGYDPFSSRRSMNLKNQLLPGSVENETKLMPPSRDANAINVPAEDPTTFGLPIPPAYNTMTSKKY